MSVVLAFIAANPQAVYGVVVAAIYFILKFREGMAKVKEYAHKGLINFADGVDKGQFLLADENAVIETITDAILVDVVPFLPAYVKPFLTHDSIQKVIKEVFATVSSYLKSRRPASTVSAAVEKTVEAISK